MLSFGENELGARIVPALAALALILFTGWLGARLVSPDVGFVAALLLAANPGVFGLARYAILDTLFTALLFAGVGLVAVAALHERPRLQYAGYVLVAGAAMVKGPLAFVLCGLTLGVAIVMSADVRRRLLGLRWIVGLAIGVAIAAPWFVYMYVRFRGDFIDGYLLDENIKLFATDRFGEQPPFWFYFQILATGMLPWTAIVVGRFVDDVRGARAGRLDNVEVLLWAWTFAVVGFFTFSRFKLDHYVFPAAPTLCLLCARAWLDVRTSPAAPEHRGARMGMRLVGPLLIAMGTVAAYFLLNQFDLPAATFLVPVIVILSGVVVMRRLDGRVVKLPAAPWVALTAMAAIYTAIVLAVMPALERQKVVPDLARWVAMRAAPETRVASYQLNRWNTAFRFYVDRHVTMLDSDDKLLEFLDDPAPFYLIMLQSGYEEFVHRGVPLKEVHAREGMWATSGRALWRQGVPATRFVVVTR
jgi:4-amino-4-deoxy-L-arabinose transferase-like glycosyltransferase